MIKKEEELNTKTNFHVWQDFSCVEDEDVFTSKIREAEESLKNDSKTPEKLKIKFFSIERMSFSKSFLEVEFYILYVENGIPVLKKISRKEPDYEKNLSGFEEMTNFMVELRKEERLYRNALLNYIGILDIDNMMRKVTGLPAFKRLEWISPDGPLFC